MAASFIWYQDYGGSRTAFSGILNCNWKNVDDPAQSYTSFPITAGNNSYDLWMYGKFAGAYNQILNGLWAHTAGVFGTGLTLKCNIPTTSGVYYTVPATTANASLTVDMTAVSGIGNGMLVNFGATDAQPPGKAASTSTVPAYTSYMVTQLQTTGSAGAGDTITATFTLQYDEN